MNRFALCLAASALAAIVAPAEATFHFIQVEQLIGGVNGDTTAQAIQIRFRSGGQHLQAGGRMRVWDATGSNPIVIVDPTTNLAGPSSTGDRVLFASANFANYLDAPISIDYTLTSLIPVSYLAAGSLTFETNNGAVIYWRVSWGGASYTGSNAGAITNDGGTLAGDFGPPINAALPSAGVNAFLFQGSATAVSTQNIDDYADTGSAATFTNYSDQSATLIVFGDTGACCLSDGSCADSMTETACNDAGGTYQGEGTNCLDVICPKPLTGACCMSDGLCENDMTESNCIASGGTYQGHKVPCSIVVCPQPPACPADIVDSATFQPPPDGTVDGADLAYLLGEWGPNPGSLADIVTSATFQPPPDGVVDGADLAFLLGEWGRCK